MRAPRRIFRRSGARRLGLARPVGIAVCVVVACGAGAWGAAALFGTGAGSQGDAAAGPLRASAGQVAVVGGDTIRLDGRVVRLAGVEAPIRGDVCRNGADCGGAATSALANLVRGRLVECRLSGRDDDGRPYAACVADGVDLSSAIVASGWARAQRDRPALANLELRARRQGAGLWHTPD